jgi:hypothetical protein
MADKSDEVLDLTAIDEQGPQESRALTSLKKNLSHLLISAIKETGPEIDFGDGQVLVFKPKVPTTAMVELIGNDNRIEGLRSYIRLSLMPSSRDLFEELLDDLPLDALNSIVEVISEASTPFPTK